VTGGNDLAVVALSDANALSTWLGSSIHARESMGAFLEAGQERLHVVKTCQFFQHEKIEKTSASY
jgi:hypothetical protein